MISTFLQRISIRSLAALGVLSVCFLLYAVSRQNAAIHHSRELNLAGSLRYRSLWFYGAQRHYPSSMWKPQFGVMKAIRASLQTEYPALIEPTAALWKHYEQKMEIGTLDWETARRMCKAYDEFVTALQRKIQNESSGAMALFQFGIGCIGVFLISAALILRHSHFLEKHQRVADERFRVLFECSTDAHLLFDETGIVDCNEATIKMLRCQNKAEVLALHPAVLSPELQPDGQPSLEKCVEMDAAAHRDGYHRFEWMHRKMDGEEFPVEVTLKPVTLQGTKSLLVVWHDLSDQKQAESLVHQSRKRLAEAQAVARMGSWEFELDTGIVLWSEEMFRIFGFPFQQTAPTAPEVIACYHPDYAEEHNARLQEIIRAGVPLDLDLPLIRKDGVERWVHIAGRRVRNSGGGPGYRLIGTVQDITERIETEAKLSEANVRLEKQLHQINLQNGLLEAQQSELKSLATTDGLTGLKNHRAFQERLGEEFHRAGRFALPFSVVLLDVDHFKQYNDSFGHPEGDTVLKRVASLLRETAREVDCVARYGGEEFIVLLPETAAAGAKEAAERMRTAIQNELWEHRAVTASFGVSTWTPSYIAAQELTLQADQALYGAKHQGRNRVLHSEELSSTALEKAA